MPSKYKTVRLAPRRRRESTSSDEDLSDASTTPVTARNKRTAGEMDEDDGDVDVEDIDEDVQFDGERIHKTPDNITPGDRESLDDFWDFYQNSIICSAYAGFENAADLRLFILSHYFLKFYLHHRQWVSAVGSGGVLKRDVFKVIRDSFLEPGPDNSRFPFNLEDGESPWKKSAPGDNVGGKTKKRRRKRRVDAKDSTANILILMVEDLDANSGGFVDPILQRQHWTDLIAIYPHIDEAPKLGNKAITFPVLKTEYVESDLEPYNRAYSLLRHADRCFKKACWHGGTRVLCRSAPNAVRQVHTPVWMRQGAPTKGSLDQNARNQDHQGDEVALDQDQHQERDEEFIDDQNSSMQSQDQDSNGYEEATQDQDFDIEDEEAVRDPEMNHGRETTPRLEPDADDSNGLFVSPERQVHEPVIKQEEPVGDVIIDLTDSPEPEERPIKQEPEGDEGVRPKKRRRGDQDGGDEEDLQSQLEETKLQLKIVQLERRLAAQKKAKKS